MPYFIVFDIVLIGLDLDLGINEEIPLICLQMAFNNLTTEKTLRRFIEDFEAKTAYVTPGSPWETGLIERFNALCKMNYSIEKYFIHLKKLKPLSKFLSRI